MNRSRTLCLGSAFFLKIRYNSLKKVRVLFKILTMMPILLYEDKNFLALYKPAGVLVHEARSMKHEAKNAPRSTFPVSGNLTLVDWLIKNYPEVKKVGDPSTSSGQVNLRPGIVHRLDKDTSGVILVARNQKYFEYLKLACQVQTGNILNELKVEMKPFEEVIEESDIVSVHVPLNKHTAGLISSSAFSLMKKNSFFINISI